jgi:hypothetical protein
MKRALEFKVGWPGGYGGELDFGSIPGVVLVQSPLGQPGFRMPKPFDHLVIMHGERLTIEKADEVLTIAALYGITIRR